ncbi:MAG TPA: phosphoribosylanthranilate isomerase [Persephonella sp.]|uniref:N-(5'-phosphoribosyl)anthranilate isomerase n=1 Tax=Persephonella marina (strain DSM 14350 / EX-H1) TaxID=123214 RepID=C0QUC6_PERMH|nr:MULTISPECIES: phosphoribosylanthranilate isomerase [Persephonella]ACO03187.1 N-(5'phosphoribosyl)anthranilate isomerase [Persephonella marina EX-H1]HCB70090.1 phosphoribosylanthranilate isomerase [Persephonella sp.]
MAVEFIKICGITQVEQALIVSELGATHIGVIFFEKSPRHIDIKRIREIRKSIQGKTRLVAVTVNPSEKIVEELLKTVDIVQFHGNETVEFLSKFPEDRVIKAFRIKSEKDINMMFPFFEKNYPVLIDTYKEGEYGGTGKQIDPDLARKVTQIYDRIILSGGLSPENLKRLIDHIKPYGVDASSKLEIKPGIKDLEKVERFIKIARMES